jgi:hypothetical protein
MNNTPSDESRAHWQDYQLEQFRRAMAPYPFWTKPL